MVDRGAPLRDLLRSLAERPFVFVRPGGNWGDRLIYHGAEHLAAALGLRWRAAAFGDLAPDAVAADEIVYLHGGGGFTELASGKAPALLRAALGIPGATVIQGPCTLAGPEALEAVAPDIATMRAARLHFFARERRSFSICDAALPPAVERFLNEDTAFYLDRAALLGAAGPVRQRMQLVAVREDTEAVATFGRDDWKLAVLDPATYASSYMHWLRIHGAARSILTNRTHSAICGAILGTPTTLFEGGYHKNRSIWEFSLEPRGVAWLDEPEGVPRRAPVDPLLGWIPSGRGRASWRLDRWAKRMRGVPLS